MNFDVLQHARQGCWSSAISQYDDVFVAKGSRACSFAVYVYTAAFIVFASTEAWLRVVVQASAPKPKAA